MELSLTETGYITKRKILIVDDDPLNIILLRESLRWKDCDILEAVNGREALTLAYEHLPDMIIMDWQMPEMDGMEALRLLKKEERTSEIPVLMLTGVMNTPEHLAEALDEGAVDFLRKPYNRLELMARIKNLLMLSESKRELVRRYEEIERANHLIQSLFQAIPHPLVCYSPDGLIFKCNLLFNQLVGVGESEIIGKMVYLFYEGDHSSVQIQRDRELIQTKEGKDFEGKVQEAGQDYLFSKSPVISGSGEVTGIICLMTDITEMKQLHRDHLERKRRELVSSTLRLIQMNEINSKLMTDITRLYPYLNHKGVDMARQLVGQNNHQASAGFWQDFELHFEQVYERFYINLNALYPDLTPGERKLCALLRLNLSSKDIAVITSQNPQSVDVARYRLRKKLDLQSDDNLVEVLLGIE